MFLLRKLNMPRQFKEFTQQDFIRISRNLSFIQVQFTGCHSTFHHRDKNVYIVDYLSLEKLSDNSYKIKENEPRIIIEFNKDFSVKIIGLNQHDEELTLLFIKGYLKTNNFIKKKLRY